MQTVVDLTLRRANILLKRRRGKHLGAYSRQAETTQSLNHKTHTGKRNLQQQRNKGPSESTLSTRGEALGEQPK